MRVSIGPALKEASRGVVVVVRRSDPWRQSSLHKGLSKARILTTGTCTWWGLPVVDMELRLCRGLMEIEEYESTATSSLFYYHNCRRSCLSTQPTKGFFCLHSTRYLGVGREHIDDLPSPLRQTRNASEYKKTLPRYRLLQIAHGSSPFQRGVPK